MRRLTFFLSLVVGFLAFAASAFGAIGFNEQYIGDPAGGTDINWNTTDGPGEYANVCNSNPCGSNGVVRLAVEWNDYNATNLANTISQIKSTTSIPDSHIIVDWWGRSAPSSQSAYTSFVANYASAHPNNPIEIWNEPNLNGYDLNPDGYVSLANASYTAIQSADPGHNVYSGSVSILPCGSVGRSYLTDVFDNGDGSKLNSNMVTDIHVYETSVCSNSTYWPDDSKGRTATDSILNAFVCARENVCTGNPSVSPFLYVIGEMSISSTDSGLMTGTCPTNPNPAKQGSYGANLFDEAKDRGVAWVMWHRREDNASPTCSDTNTGWGAFTNSGGAKAIAQWLHP